MWATYLGFVLLVWFPEGLHAQRATQSCSAPTLDGGLFDPQQEIYSPGTQLTYTCNDEFKPAAQGWWAKSTCEHGTWSPVPQCIDKNACIPPNIHNGKYTEAQNGWYKERTVIQITCDQGYEVKPRPTTKCENGTWSPLLSCERSQSSCDAPPQTPHAVIIGQTHRDVFAVDSHVEYECEAGYTTEEGNTRKSVYCISGTWTDLPTCRSSHNSGSSERPILTVPINNCARTPIVENGDVLEIYPMFLKYQCNLFYTLVGPEVVVCYSNGMWSEMPTCRVAFCAINTEEYPELKNDGVKYIRNGETSKLRCEDKSHWVSDDYANVQCTEGELKIGKCCGWFQRHTDLCK